MNWIEILYPKPTFQINPILGKFRKIHQIALTVAYYITQTVALIFLTLIYWTVILLCKLRLVLRCEDPLRLEWTTSSESYWQESESVRSIDFKRMY